jgi:thymidylate synthase
MLRMFCEVANMAPGELIWNGGDTHIYVNHIDALKEQLTRATYPSPTLKFARPIDNIDDFKYEDFAIENYTSHPAIKMEVAV